MCSLIYIIIIYLVLNIFNNTSFIPKNSNIVNLKENKYESK